MASLRNRQPLFLLHPEFNLVTSRAPASGLLGTCRSGGMVANLPTIGPSNREVGSLRTQLSFSLPAVSKGSRAELQNDLEGPRCELSAWIPQVDRPDRLCSARYRAPSQKGCSAYATVRALYRTGGSHLGSYINAISPRYGEVPRASNARHWRRECVRGGRCD